MNPIIATITARELGLPRPRVAGIVAEPDGTIRWDLGEEYYRPRPTKREPNPPELAIRPRKAGSSLLDMMTASNCRHANVLGRAELVAVLYCIATAPFPLGTGAQTYREALAMIEAAYTIRADNRIGGTPNPDQPLMRWLDSLEDRAVTWLRTALVAKAGSSCNAPTDSYLRLAAQIHNNEPTESY